MLKDIVLIICKIISRHQIQPFFTLINKRIKDEYFLTFTVKQQVWQYKQGLILLKLNPIISDANIKFYEFYLYGAYYDLNIDNYYIQIGIEDVKNMNEYNQRKVVTIVIRRNDFEFAIADSFVETMNEASIVVEHLRQNQLEKALQILYRLEDFPFYKKIRTSDEINVMIKKTLNRINRT